MSAQLARIEIGIMFERKRERVLASPILGKVKRIRLILLTVLRIEINQGLLLAVISEEGVIYVEKNLEKLLILFYLRRSLTRFLKFNFPMIEFKFRRSFKFGRKKEGTIKGRGFLDR